MAQEFSLLWGKNGEVWNKARIPDFTRAGYQSGKSNIPIYPTRINIKDFGAKGDGLNDDTKALKAAIKKSKSGEAIYLPEGIYLITDSLIITKSNIAIRGAGQEKTILFFPKGLEELYPRFGKDEWADQTGWSWSGAIIDFKGKIQNSGIEDLTIRFPDSLYAGHNWHERGYNGVGFSAKAHNGWIRNVTFTNADMGIWVEKTAHHITASNWILNFEKNRAAQKVSGHHGVNIYGGYNLLENFQIAGIYVHDLSVESKKSKYNVFRNGKGKDLCIDHHNHEQRNNLFTNLDAGNGTRLYVSGGVEVPRGVSFNETYWNITAKKRHEILRPI